MTQRAVRDIEADLNAEQGKAKPSTAKVAKLEAERDAAMGLTPPSQSVAVEGDV